MTSVLNVDTIAAKAGTGPVALTKQQAAKAWMVFDHDNTTINSSFNTSSVTDDNVGQYDQNYTNGFTGVKNHCYVPTSQNEAVNTDSKDYPIESRTTSSKNGVNCLEGNTTRDKGYNHINVHGDLA